jgi:hypothetical protein
MDLCRRAEHHQGYWLSPEGASREDLVDTLIYHESTSDRMTSYEPLAVPGLLQTASYARARLARVTRAMSDIDALVKIRLERQQLLWRPHAASCSFFVHEQALRLPVEGPHIMHEQLLHLVLMANLPTVSLRIVPADSAEFPMFGSSFRVFEFKDHSPLVFLESLETGLFLEDDEYVERYRRLIPTLDAAALAVGESRTFAAGLADTWDRRSQRGAPIYQLEEEHP